MSKENLQIVRAAFDAYFRGDVPAMLELVDPGVVVTQLPDQPDPQTFHGREGLLRSMAEWTGQWASRCASASWFAGRCSSLRSRPLTPLALDN
ncbi:MAG: hypothetical protein E6G05_01820 [Actinobacteria bacterium]|nr:MAG: hypothetical protein E6G05_01820 [Actinomycetota bacterium]